MKTILFPQKSKIQPIASNRVRNLVNRLFLIGTACILLVQAQAQSSKQLVQADEYFAAGDYFTAANLYKQFLNPDTKSKTSGFPLNSKKNSGVNSFNYENKTEILFKQAESYRLANYAMDAASLYEQCFEKDSAKYSAALYWLAVCQRNTGNYQAATENIEKFLREFSSLSPFQQAAKEERQRLQFIRNQMTRPDSVLYHVQKLSAPSGSEKGIFAPIEFETNQFIITSTGKDSVSAEISPYHNRLFTASLTDASLQNIQPLSIEMNDVSSNQGTAGISADGKILYFTQWKKEQGQTISTIYYAAKTTSGWSQPRLLSSLNQQGSNSKQPYCSADGKYLFFASDRSGGSGSFDIWYAPIQTDGTTGEPVNAGPVVNSAANEQSPFFHHASNTLVFASDRMPGMGGYDLFTSRGKPGSYEAPENMGYPVNSSRDDVYFFANGKKNLLDQAYISSDRGSECCLETYSVSKTPKKVIMTGMIRDCNNNETIEDADLTIEMSGNQVLKTKTNAEGRFEFDISEGDANKITISKEKYIEKSANVVSSGMSSTNLFTDTVYHAALCIEKKLVIKMEDVVTVYFDYDDSRLKNVVKAKLDSIYQVMKNDSLITIQISGYSDGRGTVEYNKKLSDRRAKSCTDYLIKKGIEARRISFASFGACCPVEMELINGRDNKDARSLNRRALINIRKD